MDLFYTDILFFKLLLFAFEYDVSWLTWKTSQSFWSSPTSRRLMVVVFWLSIYYSTESVPAGSA